MPVIRNPEMTKNRSTPIHPIRDVMRGKSTSQKPVVAKFPSQCVMITMPRARARKVSSCGIYDCKDTEAGTAASSGFDGFNSAVKIGTAVLVAREVDEGIVSMS